MASMAGAIVTKQCKALSGTACAPGDKSISHRALIFAALASGESEITGLLEGDDVLRTAASMRALGAEVERDGDIWRVVGGALHAPEKALYFGNSGTGVRLVMGAVAGAKLAASFEGDESLRGRPMGRVIEPLRMMGLQATDSEGRLPVSLTGAGGLKAINCKLASPSAQVKSAILLAALGADGETKIHEPVLCRDHTERMLGAFGVALTFEDAAEGGRYIKMQGGQRLSPSNVVVPGDPSSAAFLIAAALIVPNSDVTVENVLMNPLRAGVYETFREMGANISFHNEREQNGELVADIRAQSSALRGIDVPAVRAPSMIDEYPILAVVAAFAEGDTLMQGLEELRVKESDRISATEAGLKASGVKVESGADWLRVSGNGGSKDVSTVKGGGLVKTSNDHRIAMSFLVMGLASEQPVTIDDASMIATSFPDFVNIMKTLGASVECG